jgi:hypothetical protein
VYNDEYVTFATTTPGKHTVSVLYRNEVIHKLDEKYIPDAIARTETVQDMIGSAFANLIDTTEVAM